jgi:hypothetical protein
MDNCKNCGANSFKNNKCNYCGSVIIRPNWETVTDELELKFITAQTFHRTKWLPAAIQNNYNFK